MKLIKKFRSLISDTSRSLKERVFVMLTLIALVTLVITLIGDIAYQDNIVEIMAILITLILVPFATFWAYKKNKIDFATKLISLGVVFVVIPLSFIFGGGVNGGTVPWLIFSYLYIGLVITGWWRTFMLAVMSVTVIALYYIGYAYPELIHNKSRDIEFLDSALAVIEVGLVCFIMTWFQNRLYNQENKKAKEETKKVEDLNNAQNRFFSSMSHEIRTPINSILGLNEIILRQKDASDEIVRDATNIQGAGRMLLAIINDILDFSKIEAGKMDIVPVNYNLASMISEIVNMIWLRAQEKGLELKIEVDPSIPAELFGDEVRIKQILVNLLNNAVKYTREGSVTLHIEKETMNEDQVALSLSVSDTGIGIKQDALPYLFDAFQRVDVEKNTKIEGTGLGLSIVKQLVDLMGGRITVNSVYTQGSTFIVTLWQKVSRFDAVGEINILGNLGSQKRSDYTVSFTAPDLRLLIVDDNEMNLEVERKLLDGTEIIIDTCMSGVEALNLTSIHRYDLIFMDHLMPEMDGIECMQNIRKQAAGLNNKVPIIVLTANAGAENKELYRRSGFEGYLVKPVTGRALEDIIIEHAPRTKVHISDETDISRLSMNTIRGYSRKIPVLITTGSMCDLPKHVIRKYQIESIPFVVKGKDRIFYDGVEVQTDELLRYVKNGYEYVSDAPSVEEFERFFAKELKKALNVIYISTAGSLSNEYERASQAAETYGNVLVFDSGFGSSASGMLVLLAQRMASRGDSVEKIIDELKKARSAIHCSFVTDGSFYVRKRDNYSIGALNIMKTFNIKPVIRCKEGRYRVTQIGLGEHKDVYKKYIDHVLPLSSKPDLDIIFVIYSELNEELQDYIKELILRRHQFINIVFQKASPVLALNAGIEAIGVSYIENGNSSYNISSMMFGDEIQGPEEQEEENENEEPEIDEQETVKQWYEEIDGIDAKSAIENSGSEDTFRTVLKIFYDSLEDKINEIDSYFSNGDLENYTIKVHAMKSSAKLVGALELSDDAKELEKAGKEGNTYYIRENHSPFVTKLRSFHDALISLFDEEQDVEDEAEDNEPVPCADDYKNILVKSLYDALLNEVNENDCKGLKNILDEAGQCDMPGEVKADIDKIKELYEAGDLEGIKAVLIKSEDY
ncbi:DegV family protein [Butyrivibrio sp. MC2021]|uniref:DegV family protein n=1 Tax=Butyrivibrio sp. MC2021 TaxID=1408306 RepID=UPI00068455F3|nr:DegV family protein [Butyrivibrio sp. MC2021]